MSISNKNWRLLHLIGKSCGLPIRYLTVKVINSKIMSFQGVIIQFKEFLLKRTKYCVITKIKGGDSVKPVMDKKVDSLTDEYWWEWLKKLLGGK